MILYPPLLLKIVVMFFQHSSSLLQPINAAETKIGPHVINNLKAGEKKVEGRN